MRGKEQYPWDASDRIAAFLQSPSPYSPSPNPDFVFSSAELHHAINVVFFASLLLEEGRPTRVSVALSRETMPSDSLVFDVPLPLNPENLRKLAPAADPTHNDILVMPRDGSLLIVGLTSLIDGQKFMRVMVERTWLRIYAPNPGVLHLDVHGARLLHFEGGRLSMLAPQVHQILHWAPGEMVVKTLERFSPEPIVFAAVLLSAAQKMVEGGHGGTILVASSGTYATDLVVGTGYTIEKPRGRMLADRVLTVKRLCPDGRVTQPEHGRINSNSLRAFEETSQAVSLLAKLTQIDGAVVITETMEIVRLGAMVKADIDIGSMQVINLIDGSVVYGLTGVGARHQSAAKFCAAQKDNALGFVASQDGTLTIVIRNNVLGDDQLIVLRHVVQKLEKFV